MTAAENDADREAFDAALAKHGHLPSRYLLRVMFDAGAAHARQPGEPVAYIQKEVLDALRSDKHVTGTVCSGLLKKPFGSPVPLYTEARLAPPAPVAVPDGIEVAAGYLAKVAFGISYEALRGDGSIRDRGYDPVIYSTWGGQKFQGTKRDMDDLAHEIARLGAPVTPLAIRLEERCAAYKGQVEAGAAEIEKLRARPAWTLADLQAANVARNAEWCPDQQPDLSFRGNELAGEVGEACNVIKKLERERHGWRGSRATTEQLAEELADVVICASLAAMTASVDLMAAVAAKFNATSEKLGLATRLPLFADKEG